MNWEIFSQQEYANLVQDYCLSEPQKNPVIAFVLHKNDKHNKDNYFALTQAPPPTQTHFPIVHFTWYDLQHSTNWQQIWQFYPLATIDIAYYWQSKFKKLQDTMGTPFIDISVILESCNISSHFHSIAQWKELATLNSASRELARKYNFGIRILRLWERLEAEEQQYWQNLWEEHSFGKNIIQDIICHYYELNSIKRKQTIKECQEINKNWQLRKQYGKTFPVSAIREVIHSLHSPHIYEARRVIYKQRRKFEELQKNIHPKIQIDIPSDLESANLNLQISINDLAKLKKTLQFLGQSNVQKKLQELLELF